MSNFYFRNTLNQFPVCSTKVLSRENATLLFFQKFIFNKFSGKVNFHEILLKSLLLFIGSCLFVVSSSAQSGSIQFSQANYPTNESAGSVTLELQRVGGSVGDITATIQTFDGTATIVDDYAGIPSPLTLTWSDGNNSPKTVTLPIKSDTEVEGDETFTMDIVSAHAGTPSTATVTIANTPNGTIQFSQANYPTNESAGTVTLELQRVGGSVGDITATIQTHDGTATIVDDYAGIPSPLTLTWSNGNSSPKTVTLPIKSDTEVEGDETFTMSIVSAHAGTPNIATVTIANTPNGTIQFSQADYLTNESAGTVTLELQRVGGSVGDITATIQTHDGTATIVDDYAGIPSPLTLTWSNGNSSPKTVTLPIKSDTEVEGDETFTMSIVSPHAGTPSIATVTIANTPNGTIQFSQADYLTNESAGTVTLELQRVGGSVGDITATIQTHDGTATIVDDYAGIPSPLTLTWSNGNSSPKTVTLPIKSDTEVEGDETFTMSIVSPHAGTPSIATVTIANTPNGTIQFSQADYLTNESAGTVTLELQRVGGSVGDITATIQTHDGTATIVDDYAGIPSPLTLTWSNGNSSPKTVTLPIKSDTEVEGDETFTMSIVSVHAGTPSIATVTIEDVPPGTIQFASPSYFVNEDAGTVTLEIQRVGGSIGELIVEIQTMDGTATIGTDYAGIPTPLTLSWSNGNTAPKSVTLPILNDIIVEGDETFTMSITAINPDWVGSPAIATVHIIEFDPTGSGKAVMVSPSPSVNEAAGSISLEVARIGGSTGVLSVDFQTMDGSATMGVDYIGIPPLPLTWADGNTTNKIVTIPILEDLLVEGNETFSAAISSTNPEWIGTPNVSTVTIIDNEVGSGCETPVTADAGADQSICGNTGVILAATASGAGMWSGGSGNFADATMTSTTYTPHASELGTTVMLTWTTADPDGSGPCNEMADTVDITFDEAPDAGADNFTAVCEGEIVDLLALVSVPGGTFSGPGVSGTSFDTTGLPVGGYPVTYTVNSGNSCPDDTATIVVSVIDDTVTQSCAVLDIDFCDPGEAPFYNFYWSEMQLVVPGSEFFSQNATHSLTFTEFADGTALIQGSTQSGTCSAELNIVLKDLKNWAAWNAAGGGFKAQGCDPGSLVKENLRYYVVDGTKSTITTTGGDCLEEGTFKVTQRPDPADLSTPNLGVHVGPGGALFDTDTNAEGLAGWAWMGPNGDERRWKIDFNFHIDCKENTDCRPEEVCDGIDNDGDGEIDEGFDSDNDGIPDCEDTEECDGLDNDGDGEIDEDLPDTDGDGVPDGCDICELGDDYADSDGDGVPDACDVCDGDDSADADGDGVPDACDVCDGDDTADADGDGIPDACDVCDGDDSADADGDGVPDACDVCDGDDSADADGDGVPDACDVCDGDDSADADGDGVPDACDVCDGDDTADADGDGVPDACDVCDGDDSADADGDGVPDACDVCDGDDSADADGDGVPDACDICDGDDSADADGDGVPDACDVCDGDDSADADGDGVPDACDVCDGDDSADADGDGVPDACDVCDGDDTADADGDGIPDACDVCDGDDSADADGDGVPDACDVCDGDDSADADGDGVPDACDVCDGDDSADADGDGVPDACDVCDGDDTADADGDGVPDACDVCEGYDDSIDTDGDGVPDGCDICELGDDYADSDGDGIPDACDLCDDFEVTIVDVGCENDIVTALADVSGGVGPYTFNWDGGSDTELGTDLPFGNVTVVVTDANGCEAEDTVVIGANICNNPTGGGHIPTSRPLPNVTDFKVYHVPFSNTMGMDLDIGYDAQLKLEFMDMSGRSVLVDEIGQLKAGYHSLQCNIMQLPAEVYLLKVHTGKELLVRKVYFIK